MAQARQSRGTWAQRVSAFSQSGLTLQQFADEHGINAWTLENWKYKLRRAVKEQGISTRPAASPAFLPIRIPASPTALAGDPMCERMIEARIGDVGLRFFAGVDCNYLGRLLAAIREC